MPDKSVIGGYEILEQIGSGSMGVVYKARQVSMDRFVALKVLPPKLADDERFVLRFVREARSAGKINHGNLVQVFEVGQADGVYFYSMEFVGGPTLRDLLKRKGPLDIATAIEYMTKIAGALEVSHREGIVHRDVKPENILLTEAGEPKLADLGLAKPIKDDADLSMGATAIGTPFYMSPEQVHGRAVDGRTDLYCLGATFFHLITGEPVFSGATSAAIIVKHTTETPRRLSEVRKDVPSGLEAIVAKLLEKQPSARYADATALIADLHAVANGEQPRGARPTRSRKMGISGRVISTARTRTTTAGQGSIPVRRGRSWTAWLALSAVGTVALALVIVVFASSSETDPAPAPPPLHASSLKTDASPASTGPSVDPSDDGVQRASDAEAALDRAEAFAAEQPDAYKRMIELFEIARKYGDSTPAARRAKERIAEISEAWSAASDARLADATNAAEQLLNSQDYDGALGKLTMPKADELAPSVASRWTDAVAEIRKQAKAAISTALQAARSRLQAKNVAGARASLDEARSIKYARGLADSAADIEELSGVIEEELRRVREETTRATHERTQQAFTAFVEFVERGELTAALDMAASAARDPKNEIAGEMRSLAGTAEWLLAHRETVRQAVEALRGTETSLETTEGKRRGIVREVNDQGLTLETVIKAGGRVAGSSQHSIEWGKLTARQVEALASSWKPEGPDAHAALALLMLQSGNTEAARAALAHAVDHPLSETIARRIAMLSSAKADADAERDWAEIAKSASAGRHSRAKAAELLEAIDAFERAHGGSEFANSHADEIAETRDALMAIGAREVRIAGLELWYAADGGVRADATGRVASWPDGSGLQRHATQDAAELMPVLAKRDGRPVIRFDGVDDCMALKHSLNGLTGATIVVVGACAKDVSSGVHKNSCAAIWWGEVGPWGNTFISPLQKTVSFRFGTGQPNNVPEHTRPAPIGPERLSLIIATHDGPTGVDTLYVDGSQVLRVEGRKSVLANNTAVGYIGRGEYDSYFPGDIAEVLVYSRVLSDEERTGVERYVRRKYFGR